MSAIEHLRNRINMVTIPFTDRGSRILLFRRENALYIKLAERWVKHEAEVGHYRKRPPFIDNFELYDAHGAAQSFETETYPHVAHIHSAIGTLSWTFPDPDTLIAELPEGTYTLRFTAHAQRFETHMRGGTLYGRRNTAYTTNARVVQQIVTPADGENVQVELKISATHGNALLLHITPDIRFNRSVPSPSAAIACPRQPSQPWSDLTPPVLPEYEAQYEYAWWVMRVALFSPRDTLTREAASPSKMHYVGAWLWDQYYHAAAYRHVDAETAINQLRLFIDHQQPNGMLPDAIHDEGIVTHLTAPVDADVTKPPFMAWAALKIYESSGNLEYLNELYEPMARWQAYWFEQCKSATGLAEYHHPFSSGLDDSPLFDEGMPVVAPDLNTYLVVQADCLAKIAGLIGLHEAAAKHREQADSLAALMQFVLWDDQRGYFHALVDGTTPVNIFTPFNLLPLWTGRLSEAQVERVVEHLTSERLWTEWPLATVAMDDPKFDAMQMWRGPIWVNINLLFVEALERAGKHEVARKLRRESLNLMMQHDDIYEYYNPHTAEHPPKAAPIFGWTSASFIELAIQETLDRQQAQG